MKKEKENSTYNNPVLENYMCDGQITIEDWLRDNETEKVGKC